MNGMKWVDRHVEIEPPKRPKKVTGTRLAQILGANKWSTPFQAWCEITRSASTFVSTKYTEAGKVIEPKQAEFMRSTYFMDNIQTPADKYGADYFKATYGDFFHNVKHYGGMWDYLLVDKDGNPTAVLEMKTTKRAEDWTEDIPNYYALQASLYAWLLGVDQVMMVCSFLEEKDYEHPEAYVPTTENTIVVPFRVSERYPRFDEIIQTAEDWWDRHITTGISPDYDEKKDSQYLKELRKVSVAPDESLNDLLAEADALEQMLAEVSALMKPYEDRLKVVREAIKADAMLQLTEGKTVASYTGSTHVWTVTMSTKTETKVDEKAMKADGIYDRYAVTNDKTSYTIRVSKKEE